MKAMRKLLSIGVPIVMAVVATNTFAQSVATDREDGVVASAAADTSAAEGKRHHDPVAFAQKRLARLKSKLAITPEQEPQWSAFSDTVLQQVKQMKAAHQGRKNIARTVPERVDRRLAWMKERTAAYEAVGEAAKALYADLTPEQQQIADHKLMRWNARHTS